VRRPASSGAPPSEERLELRYVPLSQAKRWDENPKRHDLDALVRSIELHGFGDPPKYDATLGALVYGNGGPRHLRRRRPEPRRRGSSTSPSTT
jgi:hypothetical protein